MAFQLQTDKYGRVAVLRQDGTLDEAGNPNTYGTFVYPKDRLPTDEGVGYPQNGGFLDPSNLAGLAFTGMAGSVLGAGVGYGPLAGGAEVAAGAGAVANPFSLTPASTGAAGSGVSSGIGGGAMSFGLSDIGNLVGIATGLSSLFGGSDSGGGGGMTAAGGYTPSAASLAGADKGWQTAFSNYANSANQMGAAVDPVLLASYLKSLGIDTQPLVDAGAQAGAQYGGLSDLSNIYAGVLGNQAGKQFGRGDDLWNLARDPNNALHDRLMWQTQERARAADSARGIGMGSVSAGNENEALRNFEMYWQQNLLDRAIGGSNAANTANQLGGANLSGSMNFGAQAPQYAMQSAQVPFQAQQMAYGFPGQAATQYAGQQASAIGAPQQQLMNQIVPYLNYGQGAGANAYTAFAGDRAFNATQNAAGMNALLTGAQGLGNSMNNPGSWLSSMFSPAQSQAMGYGLGQADFSGGYY